MRKQYLLVATAAFLVSAGPALAQSKMSSWSGVFTNEQAASGGTLYQGACAMCHGQSLEGNGEAPPLVGHFIPDWEGTTLADLSEKIHDTMPLFAPGSLSAENTSAILAFILKENGFPAGAKALSVNDDELKSINFDAIKPIVGKAARSH